MSDKIKRTHLSRKAILYIRQSTQFQVNHFQESKKLQYGMKNRINQMGWQDKEILFLRDTVNQQQMQIGILHKGLQKKHTNKRYGTVKNLSH